MSCKYWIQEQAPAGNFYDSVGLGAADTLEKAINEALSWQESFPDRVVRLIERVDTQINVRGLRGSKAGVPAHVRKGFNADGSVKGGVK